MRNSTAKMTWRKEADCLLFAGLVFFLSSPSAFSASEEKLDPKGLGFDPFVSFDRIDARELYPRTAKPEVAPDGSFLVNGAPRYLTGTIWYGATEFECADDTPGYVDELKWLYVNMPDYAAMQRIGLDAGGLEAPIDWIKRVYRPWDNAPRHDNWTLAPCLTNGLPIYVDFTASEWSHGSIWPHDNPMDPQQPGDPTDGHKTGEPGRLPKEAWTVGHHHWVPYSIVEPHGRELWLNMWREGAKDCLNMTAPVDRHRPDGESAPVRFRPWCYELMNEPAVFDESPYMKEQFAKEMRKKFGDAVPEPGSVKERVEYAKFNEACFASLLEEGSRAIRAIDPEARTCFQPCTIRTRGLDLFRANSGMQAVCSPTGGRGIMEAHMLRGMADGKPILDSEMYIGSSTNSIRNAFMDQYQRGFNVSYMFKWSRRPCDWRRVRKVVETEGPLKGKEVWKMWPEETLKHALKPSAYNFMNPYRVGTDQLLGIRIAKRDILDVNEFFTPRDRGVAREVAVLFSSPTERLAQCAGRFGYRMFDQAILGADYAHLLPDVVYEDQLTNSLDRLSRYKILVAAGVDAVYPGSANTIRKWVEAGGSLVLIGETMGLDEYGNAAPDAFPGLQSGETFESEVVTLRISGVEMSASAYGKTPVQDDWERLDGTPEGPFVVRKRFGKGMVWYANAKMPSDSIGRLLKLAGAIPCVRTEDALASEPKELSGIEVHPARRGNLDAYLVTARTLGTQVVRFLPMKKKPYLLQLWTGPAPTPSARHPRYRDLVQYRQPLLPDADGSFVLVLRPGNCVSLVAGTEKELLSRYPKESGSIWLPPLSAADHLALGKERVDQEKKARIANRPAFTVDPDRTWPLDLRPFANRRFVDKVADDGKDGWTDQGAQMCLTDTPWGLTNCNGIMMDFIRYDQNDNRDCIVMASKRLRPAPEGHPPFPEEIKGIRVDAKVSNLYFLHAIAWGMLNKIEPAMTYRFNYGDGSTVEVPIRNFREIWDWGYVAPTQEMKENGCFAGWNNAKNQGLYVWRWQNPHPEKLLSSIDIRSGNGDQIPLIAAITAEKPHPDSIRISFPEDVRSLSTDKGIKAEKKNDAISFILSEQASGFSGGRIECADIPVPKNGKKLSRLTLEVNKTPDPWGVYHENPTPQIALICRDKNRQTFETAYQVPHHPKNGAPFYRADSDESTWQKAFLDIPAYRIDDRAETICGIAIQFQFPYFASSERSGLSLRALRFQMKED